MIKLTLPIFLLGLALPASAAMTDTQAADAVAAAIAGGQSGEAIIEMLVENGRSLEDAAVLAVGVASGRERMDLARAGICAAGDDRESQQVGQALVKLVGPGEEADEVESIVALYAATRCSQPPETFQPSENPGGSTPLQQSTGGTAQPPTFPTRPPVSPSS